MFFLDFQYRKFFIRLYQKASEDDIFSAAAQVAFYFSFALFPLLFFLISFFGIVLSASVDLKGELFQSLNQILPISAFDLVKTTIDEVISSSSGGKLTLGLAVALWSASTGIDSIRTTLNSIYELRETRSWWKTKLHSLVFTVAFSILISLALAIVFYGWHLIIFVLETFSIPIPTLFFLYVIEWIAIIIVLLIVFDLLYNFVPNHSPLRWKWITSGAVIGIALWIVLSTGFRLYLNFYNTYSKIYGSLAAIFILMLWLYLTSLVFLVGGLINSIVLELSESNKAREFDEIELPVSDELPVPVND